MMVLDTTFLIDYADGVEATREYLDAHADAVFATPAPAYTEFLVGPVHDPSLTVDLDEIEQKLSWVEVVETDYHLARLAADVADEIEPQGPHLTAVDALVVAVAQEVGGTVVSDDRDHTHDETRRMVDVDTY